MYLEVGIKAIDAVDPAKVTDPKFGDFTTNAALRVAQGKLPSVFDVEPFDKAQDEQSPMEFAKILANSLQN